MVQRKAIILAAGMGTRLKPLTKTKHKCLTEVNGQQILLNALKQLEKIGVTETVIVVGYLQDQIKEAAGDAFGNMKLVYVSNDIYDKTNTSYSLLQGLNGLSNYQELFILEGDVFFDEALLNAFASAKDENATVLEKYNADLDGTFAEVDSEFYVIDWTHKSKRPQSYNLETKYKTVNIHKFSYEFVHHALQPSLLDLVKKNDGKDPIENVMMNIVRENPKLIKGFDAYGLKWFEIDDVNDLKIAEKIF